MAQIDEVNELPSVMPLADWSQEEWNKGGGNVLVRRSEHVWSMTDDGELLMAAGIIRPSFMSVPEIWVLLCRDFNKRLLRNVRLAKEYFELILAVYPRVMVRVDAEYTKGRRFIEAMGFTELQSQTLSDGRDYIVCEVRRGG